MQISAPSTGPNLSCHIFYGDQTQSQRPYMSQAHKLTMSPTAPGTASARTAPPHIPTPPAGLLTNGLSRCHRWSGQWVHHCTSMTSPWGNINFIKWWWKRVKWTNRCMHLAFINTWTISGWLLEYFCSSCGTKPHDPLSHNYSWNWSGSFQQCAGCNTGHHNQFPIDSIQCPMPSMEPNPN